MDMDGWKNRWNDKINELMNNGWIDKLIDWNAKYLQPATWKLTLVGDYLEFVSWTEIDEKIEVWMEWWIDT